MLEIPKPSNAPPKFNNAKTKPRRTKLVEMQRDIEILKRESQKILELEEESQNTFGLFQKQVLSPLTHCTPPPWKKKRKKKQKKLR